MVLDDGLPTHSSREQAELERRVLEIYGDDYIDGKLDLTDPGLVLDRRLHAKYLAGGLGQLPAGFIALDASRTWIVYWVLHGLALLGEPLPAGADRANIIAFLASCQHPGGGFGGGPYQLAHLAPTYAAVAALVTLGGEAALDVVDRPRLHAFLLRMCVPPERGGGMTMHEGGEVDVRGCYCALAACEMLGLDKAAVGEACGMPAFIRACQSHEGGIGGEPWNEGHGGYTFCGLAAAVLLGKASEALDLDRLLRWAVRCQGAIEGGFMGRTNKLVDGCYSFWQGGSFPLLAELLQRQLSDRTAAQQQRQPAQGAAAAAAPDAEATAEAAAAAQRLSKLLLGEAGPATSGDASDGDGDGASELADWAAALPRLTPLAAAEARAAELRRQLDAAVEASLEAEERYKAAAGAPAGGPAQQDALAALERAAELQRELDSCAAHAEALRCGAAALAQGLPEQGGAAAADAAEAAAEGGPGGAGGGEGRLPPLYDARALQLWLLKCCQALPRGGLRDKPGKGADYYHTCYCLSGLASAQQYSGFVLGGPANRLAPADPLCNVVAEKLAAARAHFGAPAGGSCGVQ